MLTFTTNPSAAVAATAFGTQPVVEVDDSSGNVIPGATGTVSLAITPATGTAGAQLSSCPGVAVSNGVATFSGCKIDLVGTNYTLTATISDKSITGTSAPFVVSSSGAASLSFTKQPGNATGGAPLSTQPEVTLKDSGGNPVSGSVTLSLVGGPAGAHLDCNANPASAGTGVAAFAGCSVDLAGNYQLKAMAPGGMQATSNSFTVSAGTAAMLVFDTQPSGVKGGTAFTHQPVVSVEDLGGNKVANSTVDLSITKGTGTSGAQLTCTGGKSILAATGTATYSGCAIDHVGSAYTLTAKSGGLAGISSTFDVQAGEGSQLVFTAQPVGGVVSSPFGGQPQVSVADAGGNPIDAPGVSVTLSISSGSLSCLGNPVTTNADGIAVFVGCKGDSTGSLTLHAAGGGLTPANSASFNLVSGSLLGVSPLGVPLAQTFGGAVLGRNPAATVDDVTAGTGNLELALSDLTVAAAGEPFVLNRAYNSLDTTGGVFGPGWTSILDAGVTVAPNGQTAMVRSADGQQLVFTSNGSGGWNPPPGARASLSCTGALCTVTRFDGVTFRSIGGRIQDYLNPDGYGLHFVYLGNRLTEVTGSAQALATGIRDSLGERIGTLGWGSQSSGVGANLNAVDAQDANHVWAVGNNCTIVFTTNAGSTWTKDTNVTGCSGANLTGVAVDGGAGSGWAVGQNGTLLVCSAGCDSASAAWKALGGSGLPSSLLQFTGVWSPDSNHVYAVGTTTGGAGQIWSCSNNCKAITNGGTGAKWTEVTPGGLGSTALNAVEGSGGGLIFAAGAKGTILVCSVATCSTSSSGWSKLTAGSGGSVPDPGVTFTSIWAGDGSHVFAAGSSSGGGGVVWACSAKCDKSVTGPDPIPSPPGGPASGTNAAWGDDTPAGIGPLVSVTGHGADNAWAIQPDGTIWYCSDNCTTEPTAWVSLLKPGGPGALAAIGSSDDKHAWAVGTGGKVVATLDPGAPIDKLANAIGELGIALNPTAWADGNHLVPALGEQAMGHLSNAIHQLSDYPAPKPPGPTTWPGWVVGGLLDLTQAMRIVDANLISENFQQPTVPLSLANARSGFANGDALLAASDYQHAADSYKPVWKQALTAHGGGQGSHTPLLVHVTQADSGLVTNVTTPTRSVSYDYTGGALTTFTDANGNPWTYDYSSGRLTGMTDPDGNVRLVVGYSGGRVSSAVGKGSQNHFNDTYDWDADTGIATRKALIRLGPGEPTKRAESFDVYSGNVLLEQQLPNGATISYSYDSQLDMTGLQDPAGVQRMTYNPAGDLLTQTSPTQGTGTATVGFTYDGAHHPTSSTDANGNTTSNTYSGNDLVKVTPPGPAAGATSYVYNLLGEQLETDGPTSTELDTLDGAGNKLSFRLLDTAHHPLNGLGPAFTYNEIGQKLTLTDPRGHLPGGIDATYTQTNTYDGVGNLLTTTSPGPQVTTTEYDKAGDVTSTKNPAGKTTAFVWDEPALTRTSTGPGGATTTDLYDASGNLLQTTDPGDRTTRYTYDATGDQTSVTRPSAITTYYTFDLTGNVLTTVDDAGNSSTFTYDKRHRLLTQDEHGITGATGYDAAGKVVSKTDGDGNVTTWDYTSHELPNHVTTAAGTTTFGYDLGDNLISVTDGKGHVTSYRVDGAGRRTQMTVNGHSWTYSYDVAGNLVQTTDPDGRTASYTVNPLNLRTQIEYSQPGHPTITVTQTFDPLGHRIGMTDSTGTHSYAYDDGGNLTSAFNPSGNFTYDYSHPGKMIETYPDGTKETYAFDDAHDVMSVDSSTGVQVSYIRNAARRITGLAYGNGIFQTQSLSKAGLINGIALFCGQTLELTSATSYSAGGAPRSQALTAGDTTTTTSFGYDGSARVSAQASSMDFAGLAATTPTPGCTSGSPASPGSPDGNDGSGTTTTPAAPLSANQPVGPTLPDPATLPNLSPIGYDAVGNQTSVGGTSISYNAADEVSSQTGTTPASYAYDSAGNITVATVGGLTTTYSYDAAGRLVEVVRGAKTVDYSYDGDGNRVGRTVTVSGTTTSDDTLSWDPSGQVPLLALERDSSSRPRRALHLRRGAGRDGDARRHVLPPHRRPRRRDRALGRERSRPRLVPLRRLRQRHGDGDRRDAGAGRAAALPGPAPRLGDGAVRHAGAQLRPDDRQVHPARFGRPCARRARLLAVRLRARHAHDQSRPDRPRH